jgi:hypothetical protein
MKSGTWGDSRGSRDLSLPRVFHHWCGSWFEIPEMTRMADGRYFEHDYSILEIKENPSHCSTARER